MWTLDGGLNNEWRRKTNNRKNKERLRISKIRRCNWYRYLYRRYKNSLKSIRKERQRNTISIRNKQDRTGQTQTARKEFKRTVEEER